MDVSFSVVDNESTATPNKPSLSATPSQYILQGFPKQGIPRNFAPAKISRCSVYHQSLSTLKAACIESNGKNWLLNPGTSSTIASG
jgi:hypothetical protein